MTLDQITNFDIRSNPVKTTAEKKRTEQTRIKNGNQYISQENIPIFIKEYIECASKIAFPVKGHGTKESSWPVELISHIKQELGKKWNIKTLMKKQILPDAVEKEIYKENSKLISVWNMNFISLMDEVSILLTSSHLTKREDLIKEISDSSSYKEYYAHTPFAIAEFLLESNLRVNRLKSIFKSLDPNAYNKVFNSVKVYKKTLKQNSHLSRYTAERSLKISLAQKGKPKIKNTEDQKRGYKKRSENKEWLENIRTARAKKRKKISAEGVIYDSVDLACAALGISPGALYGRRQSMPNLYFLVEVV
jgi:hypothetical protein